MIIKLPRLIPAPTVLDKSQYLLRVPCLAARIPTKLLGQFRTALPKAAWVSIPRIKAVIADPNGSVDHRAFLLNPQLYDQQVTQESDVSDADVRTILCKFSQGLVQHELILDYDYWLADDILSAALPEDVEVPSSFEIVGHLAHLNLRPEHDPYKKLIGQVILDKNRALRTVVSKVGTIDTTFRFFAMEVLAGDADFAVEVRQSGCRFRFDYSKVYWNSRLSFEHERLVNIIKKGEAVCDVFCGVGPFAIPAAQRGALVVANDLNPASYEALCENADLNAVKLSRALNMDGREVILRSAELLPHGATHFSHYIMNLPAIAVTFCSAFDEIADSFRQHWQFINIHVYLFVKPTEEPVALLKAHIKHPIAIDNVHMVRTVAPNKDMYCISFRLCEADPSDSPVSKKAKVE